MTDMILYGCEAVRSAGFKRKYVRTFRLRYPDTTSEHTAVNDPLLPEIFEPHPDDNGAMLKSRSATPVARTKRKMYDVTCEYDNEPVDAIARDRERTPNPLERPPEISWGYQSFTKPIDRDVEGNLIATVNDEAFDPFVEVDDFRPTLRIKRNELNFNAGKQLQYGNSVNKGTFYGAPAGKAKMLPMIAARRYEEDRFFWEVNYEIHFDRIGWKKRLLHQGYRVKRASDGKVVWAMEDGEGGVRRPATKPILLNDAGFRLTQGDGDVKFREFVVYHEENWSALRLE